jgi:hypothetical protein
MSHQHGAFGRDLQEHGFRAHSTQGIRNRHPDEFGIETRGERSAGLIHGISIIPPKEDAPRGREESDGEPGRLVHCR